VRCGEAEARVHFIGPGRRWGGGDSAGGGGVKGGKGDGTTPIQWGK
jgi:hypothetical protein